nr:hypothetical protein [Burkholderia sp. Tr-20390]
MQDDIQLNALAQRHPYAQLLRGVLRPQEERVSSDGTEVERVYLVEAADAIAFSQRTEDDALDVPVLTDALLAVTQRVVSHGRQCSRQEERAQLVPDLLPALNLTRRTLEGMLLGVQEKLKSEYRPSRIASEPRVLQAIRLQTEETSLVWALELLPEQSSLPIAKGRAPGSASTESVEQSILEAGRILQKRIDEVSSALSRGDLSLAQFPRVEDEARAELEATVDVLNRVLDLTPGCERARRAGPGVGAMRVATSVGNGGDQLAFGSTRERNTILAALRFYQRSGMGEPANRTDDIDDIATDGGDDVSLDADGIDALCERINLASNSELSSQRSVRVLVSHSDGMVEYSTDEGVEVHVFDRDIYEDDPSEARPAPAHFRDLAEALGVPVQEGAAPFESSNLIGQEPAIEPIGAPSIARDAIGNLVGRFSVTSVEERATIDHALTAYGFLIARNERITISQFADRVAAAYDISVPQNAAVVAALRDCAARPVMDNSKTAAAETHMHDLDSPSMD